MIENNTKKETGRRMVSVQEVGFQESAKTSGRGQRKSLLLINDTSETGNPGCRMVRRALDILFPASAGRSGIDHCIPLHYWADSFHALASTSKNCTLRNPGQFWTGTPTAHSVSLPDWQRRTLALSRKDAGFRDRLEASDAVVINGEGSIHHNFKRALALLAMMKTAEGFPRPVLLLNATVQAMEMALLQEVMPGLGLCHAREKRTFDTIKPFFHNAVCAPDLAFLAMPEPCDFDDSQPETESSCLVTAGVLANLHTVHALLEGVWQTGLKPVYFCIGDGGEDRLTESVCRQRGVEWIRAKDIPFETLPAFVRRFPVAVSGRHHINIVLLGAGVPFVPIPSNTWKIEETLSLVGYPVPMVSHFADLPGRINDLMRRREALAACCRESFQNGRAMMKELQDRIQSCGY